MDNVKKSTFSTLWPLAFLILCPVIEPGGRRINFAEFYIYLSFFIGASSIIKNRYFYITTSYAIGFFIVCLLTSLMAGTIVNAHDIYVLRLIVQSAFCFSLFSKKLNVIKDIEGFYYKSLFVVTAPAILVFLQKINILNIRSLVKTLYSPKFFFLGGSLFDSYRYTSIFKDFFTAGIYFIIAAFYIFYFILASDASKKKKRMAFVLLGILYVSQLYVSRTSLLFIPFTLFLTFFLSTGRSFFNKIKTGLLFSLIALPSMYFAIQIFISMGFVNEKWVMAGFDIFLSGQSESSSFDTLNEWNSRFFLNLLRDPTLLFLPKHTYNLSVLTDGHIYSDSFYVQEIYRYGIYGALTYLSYVLFLGKAFLKEAKELFALLLVLIIINYKGGNVFFLPKTIYLLSFVIIVVTTYSKRKIMASHN